MIISNESMDFNDPKELDDPQLFDDPSYLMIPSYSMVDWTLIIQKCTVIPPSLIVLLSSVYVNFPPSGSRSGKYVLRLLCNNIGSKLESQRVFAEMSRQ